MWSEVPNNIKNMSLSNPSNLYEVMKYEPIENILLFLKNIIINNCRLNSDNVSTQFAFISVYPLLATFNNATNILLEYALIYANTENVNLIMHMVTNINSNDIDISIQDCGLLKRVVEMSRLDDIKTIIQNGGYIKSKKLDCSLLMTAISSTKCDTVKTLIEYGVSLDLSKFESLMRLAISNRCLDIMEYFLKMGLDPNINNASILNYALNVEEHDAIELLINYGAKVDLLGVNTLARAIKSTRLKIIKLLVNNGVDFTAVNDYEIENDDEDNKKIDYLLELGIDAKKVAQIMAIEL